MGRTEETLGFLRRRFERFGARSSQPACTLYWALDAAERTPEALAVLDEALRLRPDDGELLLFAARCRADNGDFTHADEFLASAEGRCPRVAWLRASAHVAEVRGSERRWGCGDRWSRPSRPRSTRAGRWPGTSPSARAGRRRWPFSAPPVRRFPHNFPLHQLLSGWVRDEGPLAQEPVVRHIIAIQPADASARRELAVVLTQQGRLDAAEAEMEEAHRLEPESPSYWCVLGSLRKRQGRRAEAREAFRSAIRLSVDNDWAIGRLIQTADTLAERREAHRAGPGGIAASGDLRRRVAGLPGARPLDAGAGRIAGVAARGSRRPAGPVARLVGARLATDPDGPGRRGARALAAQATERFPLLPALWLDLAEACRAWHNAEGELAALKKTVQMRPGWAVPVRRLGEAQASPGGSTRPGRSWSVPSPWPRSTR